MDDSFKVGSWVLLLGPNESVLLAEIDDWFDDKDSAALLSEWSETLAEQEVAAAETAIEVADGEDGAVFLVLSDDLWILMGYIQHGEYLPYRDQDLP